MNILKTVKSVILVLLFVIIFSGVSLADSSNSFYKELKKIDVFHPPTDSTRIPLYNEWHYFNVVDEKQQLSLICVLKLNGALDASQVLLACYFNDGSSNTYFNAYPLSIAQYSSKTPDVTINNSSIKLTPEGYSVHIVSEDGTRALDALFKPEAEPSHEFSTPSLPNGGVIKWIVASPKMKVNGKYTLNGKEYTLKNAIGYHDHNWGYWNWRDLGWDWGQVTESKNSLNGNDIGKYSINFGNITDPDDTQSFNSDLNLWSDRKVIATFTKKEMRVEHYNFNSQDIPISQVLFLPGNSFPLPFNTKINVSSRSGDYLNINFTTDFARSSAIPITIPTLDTNGNMVTEFRIIWEMRGTYQVNGEIKGKPISFTSNGFMEYVAGDAVLPQVR
ncbi:MAG: hypothetical protein QG646_2471 [Euryarchaeota archaeon]|nr:hypothetical protein [Euryarchaeota archaeon]